MSDSTRAPVRAFLVEDDPVHRMILQRIAGRLGGEVEVVGTASTRAGADEAIAAMDSAPDVVLLDLTLPDSALDDTVAALPELIARWGARVVATSALDDEAAALTSAALAREAGRGAAVVVATHDRARIEAADWPAPPRVLCVQDGAARWT